MAHKTDRLLTAHPNFTPCERFNAALSKVVSVPNRPLLMQQIVYARSKPKK
jgi:hypothetical protein